MLFSVTLPALVIVIVSVTGDTRSGIHVGRAGCERDRVDGGHREVLGLGLGDRRRGRAGRGDGERELRPGAGSAWPRSVSR